MSQLSPKKPTVLPPHASPVYFSQRPLSWLYAFWKFSRPHTIVGTSLSTLGVYLIALSHSGRLLGGSPEALGVERASSLLPHSSVLIFLLALVACLCGNVYIVGLNQLEDVEIDRINKPHLPLASGEFSRVQGWTIVCVAGLLGLIVSVLQSPFLMATVWVSVLIGTAYSLPPVRLKRFPVWASLCIFSVRGAIVNLGLFLHFNQAMNSRGWGIAANQIPSTVWALTLFILVFTFAIAIFKDIPDLEGDRRYHITTFTVQLGQTAVFNLARWVLTVCYLGMIVTGLVISGVNSSFLVVTHALILVVFWVRSLNVNLQDRSSIARFYQFIWKLFFLEYLLFPVACLLS